MRLSVLTRIVVVLVSVGAAACHATSRPCARTCAPACLEGATRVDPFVGSTSGVAGAREPSVARAAEPERSTSASPTPPPEVRASTLGADPSAAGVPGVSDPDAAALPAAVAVAPARPWKVIVLHHSASARGGAAAFDAMHKARGWDGVGYDFVIGNGTDTGDGEIEVTFRWREQRDGAHAKGWNDLAIGICLVGDFDEADPTPAQTRSLVSLLRHLRRRFEVPPQRIVGHGAVGVTACPGKRLPIREIVDASAPTTTP